MEQQKLLNLLRCLRVEIATLCIVKCRMSHERVVRDQSSGLPVACRFPEGSYHRVGLCTPALRARRLGCSHTSARIKLDDAIRVLALSDGGNHRTSTGLSCELAWLNNAIHLLDHRKGEAEKRLARILDEVNAAEASRHRCEKVREAEDDVCQMEQLHDEYVERLGRLRDRVIQEIDKLLVEDSPTREAREAEAV
jgi:hypothetical protein